MSTRKNSLVIATVRVGWFPFFAIVPLRCLSEVIEGYADILCLFRFASKKIWYGITFLEDLAGMVRNYGPLDLADVDIKSPDETVRVRLLLR